MKDGDAFVLIFMRSVTGYTLQRWFTLLALSIYKVLHSDKHHFLPESALKSLLLEENLIGCHGAAPQPPRGRNVSVVHDGMLPARDSLYDSRYSIWRLFVHGRIAQVELMGGKIALERFFTLGPTSTRDVDIELREQKLRDGVDRTHGVAGASVSMALRNQ